MSHEPQGLDDGEREDGERDGRGSNSSCLSLIGVGFVLLLVIGGLLILPLGNIVAVMLVGGVLLGGLIAAHYFIWGWWLTKVLEEERLKEQPRDLEKRKP